MMATNVLVPIDGADQSYGGVAYALETFPDAEFHSLHVLDTEKEWQIFSGPGQTEHWQEQAERLATSLHDRAATLAAEYGTSIERETKYGIAHKRIVEYIVENDIDHVVLGRHGESPIASPFMGHVTEAVIRRSPVSTTVVPLRADEVRNITWPGDVLVPIDGSDPAQGALEFTASQFEATVTAIHAIERMEEVDRDRIEGTYLEEQLEGVIEDAEELLATADSWASERGVELRTSTEYGPAEQAIIEYATSEPIDQIIMGSHGRTGLSRLVLGSVAETVAQRSPVPVTIYRELNERA